MTDHMTQLRLEDAIPTEPVPDMLTPDPLIVRLNKVFSWQQSASRWPYYLSRAEPGRVYTRSEIVAEVFGDDLSHHRAPQRGWLQALYSLHVEREHSEIILDGIGLFESADGGRERFHISADGLALAHAYSTDRASDAWKRIFAGILARNDVRVRAILLHLTRRNAYLSFRDATSASGFFETSKAALLRLADGEEWPLFEYQRGASPAYSFTPVLQHDPYHALGPFLRERIERAGVHVPARVNLEGGREPIGKINKEPSGNDLRLYMKQALALFRDIGALVYVEHRQGWTLDVERCAALFEPALVADLFGEGADERFLNALQSAYRKFSDDDGYVRVASIREYVGDELDIPPGERNAWFNTQVGHYLRPDVGRLRVGRTFHAQAAPDECLFGNLEMEYVEFLFTR